MLETSHRNLGPRAKNVAFINPSPGLAPQLLQNARLGAAVLSSIRIPSPPWVFSSAFVGEVLRVESTF